MVNDMKLDESNCAYSCISSRVYRLLEQGEASTPCNGDLDDELEDDMEEEELEEDD